MPSAETRRAASLQDIVIARSFDAPRELVFQSWSESAHVQTWFCPSGYTVTACSFDARRGGRWRVEFRSATGSTFIEDGEFLEVTPPERLVFSLTQHARGQSGPQTLVTVTFAQAGAKTDMVFRQSGFESVERRDGNAEGWGECFVKLDSHLGGH